MSTPKTIPTAAQVAKVLLELAELDMDVDQEPMTNMRLQKLLYYVQGWSLARRNERAFAERLQAWEHGPVVPSLYKRLKDLGKNPIPADRLNEPDIDPDLRAFVASVWEDYRIDSAITLRHRTHEESPWKDAWAKRRQSDFCQEEITEEALRAFFSGMASRGVKKFKRQASDASWYDEPSPFDKASA